MFDIHLLWIATILFLAYSVYYFLRRNDELPVLVVLFLIATGLMRYGAVISGKSEWVNINYQLAIFNLNDDLALRALDLFLLGTTLFVISYAISSRFIPKRNYNDSEQLFNAYLYSNRKKIVLGFMLFLPLNAFAISSISGSLALGNSYFWLFGLAIGGLILLLYNVFILTPTKSLSQKFVIAILMIYGAYLSFNPTLRFQFLSWMIAIGIFIFRNYRPFQKIKYYLLGGLLVIILFTLAGVARTYSLSNLSFSKKLDLALQRNEERQDQNMLDGFMMVLEVYPRNLGYRYGLEHLSILARPIPRQLWPGKPVGGYANRLGLNDPSRVTVGISQTLYGTFYEEGGVAGIILITILYGYLFARLMAYASRYNSNMKWILKGIILASLLPLLRGGDLPGIYAFIGMSFWPVFLFLYYYNKYLVRMNNRLIYQ